MVYRIQKTKPNIAQMGSNIGDPRCQRAWHVVKANKRTWEILITLPQGEVLINKPN
jgi:hypothetical protein